MKKIVASPSRSEAKKSICAKGASILLITTLLISGCSLFQKDPQKVVNEGVQEFAMVKKMHSSMTLSGTISAPPGEKPEKIRFTLTVNGTSDVSDSSSPLVDSLLKLDVTFDDKKASGELAFRVIEKKIFAKLANLALPGDAGSALGSVVNTWWMMPDTSGTPFGQFSDQQKQIQELLKTTNFFTNPAEDSEEELDGVQTTKYRVELNKEAVKKFISETARLADAKITPEDEMAIGDGLKDLEVSGAVWIGEDDVLHRVKGTITIAPVEGSLSSFDIDYRAWGYGEDIAVAAPENSQEFNPLILLPLIGALSGLEEGAPVAPAGEGTPIDQPLGASQVQ